MSEDKRIAAKIDDAYDAVVLSCDTNILVAITPKAFPPGRPLEVTLLLDDKNLTVVGRCVGIKKRDDGEFDLRVRLQTVTRDTRDALLRVFPATKS
jgi:hypothetical protein